tara:strand:- start:1054 stop:1233 length:180 start_codon:yes stop_codon:yes gene_type:complete
VRKRFAITAAAWFGFLIPWHADGALRGLVVSHADAQGILQLYRVKEDGSASHQVAFCGH